MKFQVYSKGLDTKVMDIEGDPNSLSVDPPLVHKIIEEIMKLRFNVAYRMLLADPVSGHYAVECEITDTIGQNSVIRVGEVSDAAESMPIMTAYDKAFVEAAKAILILVLRKSQDEPELTDDTRLLIGSLRGKTVGEVKDTPQFLHFLSNLLATNGLAFPDAQRTEQLNLLMNYAREVVEL